MSVENLDKKIKRIKSNKNKLRDNPASTFSVSVDLVSHLFVGGCLGYFLDGFFQTFPLCFLICFILSFISFIFAIIRATKRLDQESDNV